MSDKYFTVNIRAYLDKDEPTYIGEESLYLCSVLYKLYFLMMQRRFYHGKNY